MTITTADQLLDSMGNNSSRIIMDKASIANMVAGNYYSLWRATGQPGQGAIATSAGVCASSLVGSFGFTQQTSPATSYLGIFESISPFAATTIEVHDRLMHMGGLNGTLTTAQTVGINIDSNLATSNLDLRKGDANYSDVQWWLEWYADTGATSVTCTVNVTYNDSSSGNLSGQVTGATVRASRMFPLNALIPAASGGKYIMRVNSLTLSATTAAAGNFGVTATRYRAGLLAAGANARYISSWAELGLPEIYNSSCLFPIIIAGSTSSGNIRGTGKIVHG